MATLKYKYPVKINCKVYKAGEAVDEQLIADGSEPEKEETVKVPETPDGGEADGDEADSGEADGGAELTGMSLEQLKQYAKDNGFDIKGCKTKSDIIEAIEKA